MLNAGIEASFLQMSMPDAFRAILPNQFYYLSKEDLGPKIKALAPDVIHAHAEPAWLASFAKECLPDTPVVFDAHDLNYCRSGNKTVEEDERRALCDSDAVILPSYSYQKAVQDGFGVKLSEVIYSMCNAADIPEYPLARVNGIVYEGGMVATSEAEQSKSQMRYNDYRTMAVKLHDMGIAFHCYPGRADYAEEHIKAGVVWHWAYQHKPLLHQLTRYDWGLVGAPFKNPQWDMAMPNKLFDYVAAGIPPLVINAEEAEGYVHGHNEFGVEIGWSIKDISQLSLPEVYIKHEHYRNVIGKVRHKFTMDTQMPKLINLYTEAIKRCQQSLKSSTVTKAAAKPALVSAAI